MSSLIIRTERAEDSDAIRSVNEDAFGPGSDEGALVDALRASGAHVPELCLVAEDAEEVIGHVFFSRARLESGHDVLALAPMAVAGRWRARCRLAPRPGAMRRADDTGFPLVVVVGHPEYYPRFGFEPAADHGVRAPGRCHPRRGWCGAFRRTRVRRAGSSPIPRRSPPSLSRTSAVSPSGTRGPQS